MDKLLRSETLNTCKASMHTDVFDEVTVGCYAVLWSVHTGHDSYEICWY